MKLLRLAPIEFHYFERGKILGVSVSGRKCKAWDCVPEPGVDYSLLHRMNVGYFVEWLTAGIMAGEIADADLITPWSSSR